MFLLLFRGGVVRFPNPLASESENLTRGGVALNLDPSYYWNLVCWVPSWFRAGVWPVKFTVGLNPELLVPVGTIFLTNTQVDAGSI